MQAVQGKHSHSNSLLALHGTAPQPATATCIPVPPQKHTSPSPPQKPRQALSRATHTGMSEGTCPAAGCKTDPTSTTPLPAPPLAPVPRLVVNRPCGSCASRRVALRREEEGRPALALALIPGHVVGLTAPLPFARGSDGRCSSRSVIHASGHTSLFSSYWVGRSRTN